MRIDFEKAFVSINHASFIAALKKMTLVTIL